MWGLFSANLRALAGFNQCFHLLIINRIGWQVLTEGERRKLGRVFPYF
ncbi:hypothetical protein HMPREF9176_1250 [Streptococcus downei F0415]|nr:hypothetical protein HMPREF9176_1250 [Streptococcus downei F0415]